LGAFVGFDHLSCSHFFGVDSVMNKRTILSLGATFLSLFAVNSHAAYELNLKTPATEIASQIYDLHMLIIWVCLAIFVVVFGLMFYSIFKHRKSTGHQASQFHENHLLEVIWTIIPVVILASMAYPATKTILAMKDTSAADMEVKVTASQWKWGYDYMGQDVKFISTLSTTQDQILNKSEKGENYLLEVDNPMVVPVGKKSKVVNYCSRRNPFMVGPGIWCEARCDSRFCQRSVV
jgi:cytochrome c oxidase subunit 2